jgi:hypothetical protein
LVTVENFWHHNNINSICSYSWPICTQQLFLYHFIIPALDTQAPVDQKPCFCVGLEKRCCHWGQHHWYYDPFNLIIHVPSVRHGVSMEWCNVSTEWFGASIHYVCMLFSVVFFFLLFWGGLILSFFNAYIFKFWAIESLHLHIFTSSFFMVSFIINSTTNLTKA